MRVAVLCVLMLLFSGCLSENDAEPKEDEQQESGENLPVTSTPQELSEPEKTEPRGEPTRRESDTEVSTNPPGSTKTITFENSMLSVAEIRVGVPNHITVERTASADYSIQFVLNTGAVGPAADVLFEQYEISFEDYIEGSKLVLEATSQLKEDSPFACQDVGGSSVCVGIAPVSVSVVASIPESYSSLYLNTNLGEINVQDVNGGVIDAGTNTGNLDVKGDFNTVELGTNTGTIRYEGEAGVAELTTNSGTVSAFGAFAELSMGSNSGNLDGEFAARTVEAGTNTGNAKFAWTPIGSSIFEHDGNSGSFELSIPTEFEMRLELSSNLGRAETSERYSEVEEDVWETSGYEQASEKSQVYSHVNTGTQTVQ